MKGKHRRKILLLKAAVSAAFFFILISFAQSNKLITVFTDVNWFFFTLSFFLAIVMLMVSCLKWKFLLDASGKKLNYFILLRTYLIGYFFSNLLPSTVGGDLVRSYYTGRLIDNQASAAASIFLERFTGMLFLLVLVVTAPLMQPELYRSPFICIPAIGAAFLLFIVLWLWKVKEPLSLPDRIIKHLFTTLHRLALRTNITYIKRSVAWIEQGYIETLKRLCKFKTELKTSLATIRSNKQLFTLLFILTAVFYLLTWMNVYISFLAFNVQPSFIATSALVPTIMFVGQVPLTLLGNLGFIESLFVFYFLMIQIPAAESLAMGLLLRVKMLWLGIMGYFVYLTLTRAKNSKLNPACDLIEK